MRSIAGRSFTIGSFFNIPIKIHWSFGILLLFVAYVAVSSHATLTESMLLYLYFLSVFAFVVMHEYGHALAARKYGVKTRDIIISPIGGVARLESIPENPRHELIVAIAGPMVNVVWYVVLIGVQLMLGDILFPSTSDINLSASPKDMIRFMMLINGTLVLFNMVPAFPMDGGRVLRAATTMITNDRTRATMIASILGQIIAAGFIAYGIYMSHYALIFIGVFVIFTARQEYHQVQIQQRLNRSFVAQVMQQDYPSVHPEDLLDDIISKGGIKNYLVKNSQGSILGALPSLFLVEAQKANNLQQSANQLIHTSFGYLNQHMTISTAFNAMNKYGWVVAPVIDDQGEIIGTVDRDIITDFING